MRPAGIYKSHDLPYFAVYYMQFFSLQLQCKKFSAYNIMDRLTFCYCRNPVRKS